MINNGYPAPFEHICDVIVRNNLITDVCALSAGLSVHFYRRRRLKNGKFAALVFLSFYLKPSYFKYS